MDKMPFFDIVFVEKTLMTVHEFVQGKHNVWLQQEAFI